ncbi:MAG: hypothetical protein ABI384_06470, partial [Allobranchiibius sp.]
MVSDGSHYTGDSVKINSVRFIDPKDHSKLEIRADVLLVKEVDRAGKVIGGYPASPNIGSVFYFAPWSGQWKIAEIKINRGEIA